ncbi:translocation/assembly module TamB [Pseudomonas sp. R2.Fl]|nr:translocation/assembly module TamB [Pseudomonas sp. R2.Fl]
MMAVLKRLTLWFFRLAGAAAGIGLALGIALVVILGFTTVGSRLAASWISALVSSPSSTVSISNLGSVLDGRLRIDEVTLADEKGIYARIDDLEVDWSPSALLARTFRAERISAAAVELRRLPESGSEADGSGSGNAGLPIELDIGTVSLPLLKLGPPVLGQELSLSGEASVAADRSSLATTLNLRRIDSPETRLRAELRYSPADNALVLDGSYSEPPSGILGARLRIPSNPAVAVSISGEGPLSDWKGKLLGDLDGSRVLSVDVQHQLDAEGVRQIGVAGGGEFANLLPPWLRPTFAGETAIDLSAALHGADSIRIDTARLSTDSLLLTATGTLDRAGQSDLKASLVGVGAPVDIRWPLADGELSAAVRAIDLTATGPAQAVRLDLRASLASLATPAARVEGLEATATSGAFDLSTLEGDTNVALTMARSRFTDANIDRAVKAPATIRATLATSREGVEFNGVEIDSATIDGTLNGRYVFADEALDAEARLSVPASALPDAAASRVDGDVGVTGNLSYRQGGAIDMRDLNITSDLGTISGSAQFADGSLSSDIEGTITNLGRLLANATGAATFSASTSGPVERMQAQATLTVPEAMLAGRRLTDFSLTANGIADMNAPEAVLEANGEIDGQPIAVNSSVETAEGSIRIPALSASVGANRVTGNVSLDSERRPTGEIDFDLPQIELVAALLGQQISGDLAGTVNLASQGDRIGATIAARGGRLIRDSVEVAAPEVQLTISDLADLRMQGQIKAGSIGSGANRAESVVLTVDGAGDRTNFNAEARYDGAPAIARGELVRSGGDMTVTLREFSATPRGIAVALGSPATIAITGGAVRIDDLTLRTGDGTIRTTGTVGQALALRVAIERLPAALANTFSPTLSAAGAISGTVNISGSVSRPAATYRLNWSDATVAQLRSAGLPPLSIAANGDFSGQRLSIDTTVSGGTGLSIRGGGTVGVGGDRPLSFQFTGGVPLSLFAARLAAQGLVVEGTANADVRITGPATSPSITGQATVTNGRLTDVRRNLTIEDLSTTVNLDGNRAQIASLSGRLSGGGTISGSGTIGLGSGLPADITLRLAEAQYADGTLFTTSARGELFLRGPLVAGPTLSGNITLGETAITVPERLPASLSELDIQHRNAPEPVRRQTASLERQGGSGTSSGINLDLHVSAPSRIFVRGRGIDAELGGDLTVRGTSITPMVSGGFDLTRGRLSIVTRRLTFTNGTVTFGGNLIPLLNMEATSTAGTTNITVQISGLANDPTVSFSSSPALPEDEILAQLIFGQSMSRLSAVQIAQLADAASQLAGGRSSSLFETLRAGLGVDNLDITTDSQGNAAVSAGKYLNDRTYLELQQSENGGGKAVINLDIGRGVKLRGEAGGDGSSGAGIFYEREY